MTAGTGWVPLEGKDLLVALRDILAYNPGRHDQAVWLGNAFLSTERLIELGSADWVTVDEVREYATVSLPQEPAATDVLVPPCGTTGCVFGWASILTAPNGTRFHGAYLTFPDGTSQNVMEWAGPRMGMDPSDSVYMSDPARSRAQLIAILNARIADPRALIRTVEWDPAQ